MRNCWKDTDWNYVKPCCSSGRPYWKKASAGWKIGFGNSGRHSLKKWATRTRNHGFRKWNGSAEVTCSAMAAGSWTTGDCELRRGKGERLPPGHTVVGATAILQQLQSAVSHSV